MELIVNVTPDDVPPATETVAVPGVVKSAAGMRATSTDELWYAVATGFEFHKTVELPTKPEPLTVISESEEPAFALEGERELTEGVGVLAAVIAKFTDGEAATSPGSLTEMLAVPAVEISAAVVCTVMSF